MLIYPGADNDFDWLKCERIESDQERCGGRPVVRFTRIFPDPIVHEFDDGKSIEEIHDDWPSLSHAQTSDVVLRKRSMLLKNSAGRLAFGPDVV